ncbi:MAG: DMT family transporter [Desulfovibrionaceae bacterium]|nr:DMT family transporter [Desulfovibrionaceae bacterium]
MRSTAARANLLLTITAAIWGGAFVAQRVGMDFVGPFTFNGVRFALGAAALLPLIHRMARAGRAPGEPLQAAGRSLADYARAGALAGVIMFGGATLQQVGLIHTTAGKAGFITGLYVVFVPIMGLAFALRPGPSTWAGALMAAVGLYLLSVTEGFSIAFGDLLELIGAVFWAGHVLVLTWLTKRYEPVRLACAQFVACAVLSLIAAVGFEEVTLAGLSGATPAILYGGLMSVGVAYTLQVVAQRDAQPAHAALILSLEAVFAALAGWLLLDETMGARALAGCGLMLGGTVLAQVGPGARN